MFHPQPKSYPASTGKKQYMAKIYQSILIHTKYIQITNQDIFPQMKYSRAQAILVINFQLMLVKERL